MDKTLIVQISALNIELEDLRGRLKKLEDKPQKIVIDSVKGSSSEYPYIHHNCIIEGIENPKNKKTKKKYRKLIKGKEFKLDKLINQLEYELNNIDDSEIRQVIRFKYEDNMSWIQIQHKMNDLYPRKNYTADGIRMKTERFLKKFSKRSFCSD